MEFAPEHSKYYNMGLYNYVNDSESIYGYLNADNKEDYAKFLVDEGMYGSEYDPDFNENEEEWLEESIENTMTMLEEQIDNLDNIFKDIPTSELASYPLEVYRGVTITPAEIGDTLNSKSYVSTSTNLSTAVNWVSGECCLIKIILPPYFPFVAIDAGESEILLPRGLKFKIIDKQSMDFSNYVKNQTSPIKLVYTMIPVHL